MWFINTIKNTKTNRALDVAGGFKTPGTNVQLFTSNSTCAQQWQIKKNTDGTYRITSACSSNIVLDLAGGVAKNGGNVQIWSSNGTKAQGWILTKTQ